MDPYVVFKIGHQKQRTKTHNSGGKNPAWKDLLKFKVTTKDSNCEIIVMDEDVTSDDTVGTTTIFLDDIFKKGKSTEWIKISHKGKECGQVNIEFEFYAEQAAGTQHLM